jgi:hypothetical protein
MFHYVYRLEDAAGLFYIGSRSSIVEPESDRYMGSGVWPRECRKRGVKLSKQVISIHHSRKLACAAEDQLIRQHLPNPMLQNIFVGQQNPRLGPRDGFSDGLVFPFNPRFLGSSLWVSESVTTRVVWVTMMLMADKDGRVDASVPGLAHLAAVPIDDCIESLNILKQPDPYESPMENGGARIIDCDRGWIISNYRFYNSTKTHHPTLTTQHCDPK